MSQTKQEQKLIITIVKKEKAKKVVAASKKAGARGGTVFLGKGIKKKEKSRFLGIPVEREREIVLTVVAKDIYMRVLQSIDDSVDLSQPNQGIGFVIDTKEITGIQNFLPDEEWEEIDQEDVNMKVAEQNILYDLIVTVVNKGDSDKVVEASKQAGAEGGTIISGRGTGIHEKAKLFNILIEPEKEVILTLISRDKTNDVLQSIEKGANLNIAGKGIAFVLEVERTIGINHILNKMVND